MILMRHGQSEFNVVYATTRVDPGIEDPVLTTAGKRQAAEAGDRLGAIDLRRIVASPYRRTLHTAEIIAEHLGLSVVIEPLVRERCFFVCDLGSPRSEISARWPGFEFGDLAERWWPEPDETEEELQVRCDAFRSTMAAAADWPHVAVVSHWGFIRGLTGQAVTNGTLLRFDPTAG